MSLYVIGFEGSGLEFPLMHGAAAILDPEEDYLINGVTGSRRYKGWDEAQRLAESKNLTLLPMSGWVPIPQVGSYYLLLLALDLATRNPYARSMGFRIVTRRDIPEINRQAVVFEDFPALSHWLNHLHIGNWELVPRP